MKTLLIICLCISALTIVGYIWNKFTPGTVGCASIALFLLTGCVAPGDVLANIGNSNVIMVASMFVISEGFKRTQAVRLVARTVEQIVAPIVSATCEQMEISPSKVMFSVGLTCIGACGIIPVGGSLAMFAELNGYIAANGYEKVLKSHTFTKRFAEILELSHIC